MNLYNYPDILTVEETMDILKIGRGQCYELLSLNRLKGFKIGSKTWKIPKDSIIEFIKTNGYTKQIP